MAFTYAGQYTEVILGTSAAGFAVALPALTVNVYTVSTTTAVTLYTSRTKGSTASNPASTDVNGNLTFYANPGQYDIVFTPPGGSQKRITVMVPQDPAEDSATYAALSSGLGPAMPRQRTRPYTFITTFQTGHGWTLTTSGASGNLNDTSDFVIGSQCASITTTGTGGTSWVQGNGIGPFDLSASDVTIWVKVTNLDHLKKINLQWGDTGLTNFYQGAIYDGTWPGLPNRQMREGEWFPLRFNFSGTTQVTGAPNKANITIIRLNVQDDNTGQAVTVKFGGVAYQARNTAYSSGIVTLSFDDSFVSTSTRAAPTLAKYGYGATAFAIAELSNAGGGSLSVAQLHDLQDTYGWEVGAHAYTVANHNAGFDTLATDVLETELNNLKAWAVDNNFTGGDHFAHPLGHHSSAVDAAIGKRFATGRTIYDNPTETLQPSKPLRYRCLEASATSLAAMQTRVTAAATNGAWLVLCFHDIVASGATGNQFNVADLATLVDSIHSSGAAVLSVSDAWRTNAV